MAHTPELTDDRLRRWFCLVLKPALEDRAERELKRQGYDVWFPRRVDRAGRSASLKMLFGTYAFLRLDLDRDRWVPAINTFGVRRILTSGGSSGIPVPFKTGVVERLQSDYGDEPYDPDRPVTAYTKIQPGQEVEIVDGPFAGLDARGICLMSTERRVTLLLSSLDQTRKVTLDREKVRVIPDIRPRAEVRSAR